MLTASRPPLRRLVELDRMIRSGAYPNARDMAAELEVHPRTVHRDLDFLRSSWGAPVEFSPRHNGFHYRDPDYALPLQRLSEGELLALFLAERLMQQYQGAPFLKDLETAFRKMTTGLPDTVTVNLAHLREAYSFHGPQASAADVRRFRQLVRAVQEGRQLELVYWTASRDETCRRVVDPYHLASVQGNWYLIAYCHLREDVRMFVPGRIKKLRETGACFRRPDDFSIQSYLDGSFGAMRGDGPPRRVRLRFAPQAARYVREKVWHPTQRLRERKDGSLDLTLKVSHLADVRRWVLSYGSACRVLEPEELRREVREEIQKLSLLYE